MQKLRGWISQTRRMNSNTSSLRGSSGWRRPARENPWQGGPPNTQPTSSPLKVELVEDPLAGERADVAEEEHLARLHAVLSGDPAGAGLEGRPVGLGVVALKALAAPGPALLVLGGAEHDPGARRAEVAQVGVRGVDVVLVGGDHVPAGLLEAAGEPAGAREQVDPERLPVRVLDDLAGPHVLQVGPVGDVDAAVGDIPAVAGADRARRLCSVIARPLCAGCGRSGTGGRLRLGA